jgi:hypothetical protein
MAVCGPCWRSAQSSQRCGPLEGLPPSAPLLAVQVVEGSIPEPDKGQVRVRLQLRPVNPADIFSVQGASAPGWLRRTAARDVPPQLLRPAQLACKACRCVPWLCLRGRQLPACHSRVRGHGSCGQVWCGSLTVQRRCAGLSSEQRYSQPASTSSSVARHTLHKLRPACTSLVQASGSLVHRLTPQRGAARGSSTWLSTRASCWRCQTKYLTRRPRNSW